MSRDGARGGGFAAALENLAQHTDAATTSATAKMVGSPTTGPDLGNRHQFPRTFLLAIAALAVLVELALGWELRRRRRLRSQSVATRKPPEPPGLGVISRPVRPQRW